MSAVLPGELEKPETPEISIPEPVTAKPTARRSPSRQTPALTHDIVGFVIRSLEGQWTDYQESLKRFDRSTSAKNVHDLRVSIRRLMTALDLVDRFAPDGIIRRARGMLKDHLSELSDLRDVHVEMVRTRKLLKNLPEIREFYDDLRERKDQYLKAVRKTPTKSQRKSLENAINRAKIRLNARRAAITEVVARKIIEDALQSDLDRLSKRIQAVTLADYSTVHRVRLAFKPFRYMLEIVQPILSIDPKQLRTAAALARMMGQIQDLEVLMKDLVENRWKGEQTRYGVMEVWLGLERQMSEAAYRFLKALPRFGKIWKPISYDSARVKVAESKTLYILRHGIAVSRGDQGFPIDADRPLTPKGIKKMRSVAKGIRHLGIDFDVILSSPYRRALETAFIVGREFGAGEIIQTNPGLRAEMAPEEVIESLQRKYASCQNLLLVGHEPQLSTLVSTLISGNAGSGPMLKKGGLCKVQVNKLQAAKCGTLLWLLTPAQLANMA